MTDGVMQQLVANLTLSDSAAGLGTMPPLVAGDYVTSITFYLGSALDETDLAGDVTLEVYACNSKPATVTEARNGRVVFPSTNLPLLSAEAGAAQWQFRLQLTVPVLFLPRSSELHLAVVATPSVDMTGAAFFHIQRELPPLV